MNRPRDLIVDALLAPASVAGYSMAQWDLLIRQARRTMLLGKLAARLSDNGLLEAVPPQVRPHLVAAFRRTERQELALRWEIDRLAHELRDAGPRIILLKGAAYGMAGLPVSQGRIFSDIDILVPKEHLGAVEDELRIHGWQRGDYDDYDEQYYRRWMHEIPPLCHVDRGTTIDVHHAILPETSRIKVQTALLHDAIRPLKEHSNLYVLQPVDMLLHSATHLFHEGELEKGLRDLFDLDSLLRDFSAQAGFWEALVPRAAALGLMRPLFYALRYTTAMLDTPVPARIMEAAEAGRPGPVVVRIMDACYLRALRPAHASAVVRGTWWARFALYVRSHWIRMPVHLLAYHLGRKALLRLKTPELEETDVADADRQKA